MTARQVFDQMLRTARVLYGALVMTTVMLPALSFVVKPNVPQPLDPTMQAFLGFMAVGVAVVSFVLPPRAMATTGARIRVEVTPPMPGADGLPMPARFTDPATAARRAMGAAQQGFVLSLALSEAVSLFGFVEHMLGASRLVSTPFFIAGTVLAALRYPTVERFVAPFERTHGATFAASMELR